MPKIDDPLVQNSRKMLSKLVKQKLIVLKPPSDKLIDLILRARSKQYVAPGTKVEAIQTRLGYIQRVASHHMFDGEFQVHSACLSHPTTQNGGIVEFIALGGHDGLIEVWDFANMALETKKLKFQQDGLFMVHNSPVLSVNFSFDNRLLASGD